MLKLWPGSRCSRLALEVPCVPRARGEAEREEEEGADRAPALEEREERSVRAHLRAGGVVLVMVVWVRVRVGG